MQLLLLTGLISFIVTACLVPLCCLFAYRFYILDTPNSTLKKHKKPTPYLGGVAVFFGFIIALIFTISFDRTLILFLVGLFLLMLLGVFDDLKPIKPYQKFLGQIAVALIFLKTGIFNTIDLFSQSVVTLPLFLFWIVLVTNAFNLIDVMDGLATTVALSIASFLLIIAFSTNVTTVCFLLTAFVGALSAFLLYNKPLARIYLGDAGSLFIGGFLSVMPFLLNWYEFNTIGFLVIPVIFAVPLLEIGMLILIRTYKKIPFYRGSPDHFVHYLQKKGWYPSQILLGVAFSSFVFGLISILFIFNIVSLFMFLSLVTVLTISWILFIYKP